MTGELPPTEKAAEAGGDRHAAAQAPPLGTAVRTARHAPARRARVFPPLRELSLKRSLRALACLPNQNLLHVRSIFMCCALRTVYVHTHPAHVYRKGGAGGNALNSAGPLDGRAGEHLRPQRGRAFRTPGAKMSISRPPQSGVRLPSPAKTRTFSFNML